MRSSTFGFALAFAVSLAALPAAGQEAAEPHGGSKPQITVTIPEIETDGSSIDEATLRAILSGDVAGHAQELATLSARSITIPELHVDFTTPAIDGRSESGAFVLNNIELTDVTDGVAATVAIGGTTSTSTKGGTAKLGPTSAEDFDIGAMLAFYGLVKKEPVPTVPQVIYRNLTSAGGTVTSAEANCTIGGLKVAMFKARPPKTSFAELIRLAQESDRAGEGPSPETIAALVSFYVDILNAVEVSPITFDGFNCSGKDEDGKAVAVKVGGFVFGAFAGGGRYPEFTMHDMSVVAEDGNVGLAEFVFKGFDVSGALAAVQAAGGALDETWLMTHYRELIPNFDGFAFSGLDVDVPDEDHEGERIKASVEKFDLTLKGYINGIPSDISTLATHVVAALPAASDNDSIQRLIELGIKKFDLGFDASLKWDEAANEIRLDRFALNGVDMGAIAVSTVIGQATRDLFSRDTTTAMAAAMGMTLKSIKVDVQDSGLADVLLQSAAKDSGKDVTEFRQALAGLTQGTMLIFLGGAANATDVVKAVGDFMNGAKSLSITVTAKDPAGVDFDELNKLKEDPTGLTSKVTIDAVAK